MNILAQAQEQARRFNETEAIQQEFERRRARRRRGRHLDAANEKLLDDLDWLAAVRAHRETRAIGISTP